MESKVYAHNLALIRPAHHIILLMTINNNTTYLKNCQYKNFLSFLRCTHFSHKTKEISYLLNILINIIFTVSQKNSELGGCGNRLEIFLCALPPWVICRIFKIFSGLLATPPAPGCAFYPPVFALFAPAPCPT